MHKFLLQAPIPDEILTEFPLASVDNVQFHNLSVYSNLLDVANSNDVYVGTDSSVDLKKIPVRMQVNDIKSNFVQVSLLFITSIVLVVLLLLVL